MKKIVIIGNGIAGITTARNIRKRSEDHISVISSETDHFYSRTALMYIYMGQLKYEHTKPYEDWFWKKNKINLLRAHVESVDTKEKILQFTDGGSIQYDSLVLASGSKSNKFNWPGQDLKGVSGLYSLQELLQTEKYTANTDKAVIVGGGLIGIEMAEMLCSRGIKVVMLVREDRYWGNVLPEEEARFIESHISEHHVELRLNTELKEILADDEGRARAVITDKGEEIECRFVGLTAGVSPNIGFLADSGIETGRGVLVDEFLQASIPGVYAAGDCVEFRIPLPNRKPVEQLWYTGRIMGETLAKTICGNKTKYTPGTWFNSAKFFDIEYQTYGWVWNELKDDEELVFWEDRKAKKCLKLVFDNETLAIKGINVFGIRLRHDVCERWIDSGSHIRDIILQFKDALFDTEFYKDMGPVILESYNRSTNLQNH